MKFNDAIQHFLEALRSGQVHLLHENAQIVKVAMAVDQAGNYRFTAGIDLVLRSITGRDFLVGSDSEELSIRHSECFRR